MCFFIPHVYMFAIISCIRTIMQAYFDTSLLQNHQHTRTGELTSLLQWGYYKLLRSDRGPRNTKNLFTKDNAQQIIRL